MGLAGDPAATLGLVERAIFALHLEPRRLRSGAQPSSIAQTAARAIRLATPDDLTDRDRRVLIEVEALAPLAPESTATAAHALLGTLTADWAERPGPGRRLRDRRDAALVATIALAALVPRAARGELERRLLSLDEQGGLDACARRTGRRLAGGELASEPLLARDLALVLDQLAAERLADTG